MLKRIFIYILVCTLSIISQVYAQKPGKVISAAERLELDGKFREASKLLQIQLSEHGSTISTESREALEFEIERLRRVRLDYSLTESELYLSLKQNITRLAHKEFKRWISERRFDDRIIDDTLRFVNTSVSNLFFRYPELNKRRVPPVDKSTFHRRLLETCLAIEKAAEKNGAPYVLPKKFQMTMTLTVDSSAITSGDTLRAWLPIPRLFPYQKDFVLDSAKPKPTYIANQNSPIRSIYFQQIAAETAPLFFMIKYTYKTFGVHFDLNPDSVKPYNKSNPIFAKYTAEGPNIVFTKKIRRLSDRICGKTTNPLLKAKKIYNWISMSIKYSFAREYSTIGNISDYCLSKRYGDCGQEALLFITLCRYNGIPARWQSGWFTFPVNQNIHDWTEIFIEPYGWIPVDPYMGILATQYMNDLTKAEQKNIRDFYFGGLDQYRMAANSDNNQVLTPSKKYFRSDNVDFQRGEVESNRENIYFNLFKYNLKVEEIDNR